MEHLLDSEHGPIALIASLVVILALHLAMKAGKIVFEIVKKKTELTDKNIENLVTALALNTQALHRVEQRIASLEMELSSISILRLEVSRAIAAIKILSGEKWGAILESIKTDDLFK